MPNLLENPVILLLLLLCSCCCCHRGEVVRAKNTYHESKSSSSSSPTQMLSTIHRHVLLQEQEQQGGIEPSSSDFATSFDRLCLELRNVPDMQCQCEDYTRLADARRYDASKRIKCQSTTPTCSSSSHVCASFTFDVSFMGQDELWSLQSCVKYDDAAPAHEHDLFRNGCLQWNYQGQTRPQTCEALFVRNDNDHEQQEQSQLEKCRSCRICDSTTTDSVAMQVDCTGLHEHLATTTTTAIKKCQQVQRIYEFFPGFSSNPEQQASDGWTISSGGFHHHQTLRIVGSVFLATVALLFSF